MNSTEYVQKLDEPRNPQGVKVSVICNEAVVGYNFFGKTTLLSITNIFLRNFSSIVACNATPQEDKLYKSIEIEIRGNDSAVLKSYGIFATTAAEHLGITVGRNFAPRKAIHERFTLLKSKHIYKKHRVQYEIRTYYRFLDFLKLTGSTADTFLEYIQRNLPEGVAMKVTKVEIKPLLESINTPTVEK